MVRLKQYIYIYPETLFSTAVLKKIRTRAIIAMGMSLKITSSSAHPKMMIRIRVKKAIVLEYFNFQPERIHTASITPKISKVIRSGMLGNVSRKKGGK